MVNFPCSVCEKPVGVNMEQFVASNVIHESIQDAIISVTKTYRCLKNDPAPWYCKLYVRAKLPFSKLNNTEFARLTKIEP